jgi:hypothetical protein
LLTLICLSTFLPLLCLFFLLLLLLLLLLHAMPALACRAPQKAKLQLWLVSVCQRVPCIEEARQAIAP